MKARLALAVATLVLLAAADVAGIGPRTLAAPFQSVTLNFVRFYANVCNCYKATVSGQIASSAAGEEVVILKQNCGRSFGTSDAVAYTIEGGHYQTEVSFVPHEDGIYSAIYRARWRGQLSAPVIIRGQLTVKTRRLPAGRRQIVVSTLSANPVNLKGRAVVLHRKTGDGWTRVASARLAPHPRLYYTFVATFPAQRRGWTLRALVPAKSAAPCFRASVSQEWMS